jgi:hypothetical protein
MPSDRHVFETETLRELPRAPAQVKMRCTLMMRPRPAADVVVAVTLGRLVLRAVGCSSPVVAPLGHAQRKRKMYRKSVVF